MKVTRPSESVKCARAELANAVDEEDEEEDEGDGPLSRWRETPDSAIVEVT